MRYTIGGTGSGILDPEGSREELEQALLSLLEQGREEDLRLGSTGQAPIGTTWRCGSRAVLPGTLPPRDSSAALCCR